MSWRALGRCDRIPRSPATVAVISRVIRGPLSCAARGPGRPHRWPASCPRTGDGGGTAI